MFISVVRLIFCSGIVFASVGFKIAGLFHLSCVKRSSTVFLIPVINQHFPSTVEGNM